MRKKSLTAYYDCETIYWVQLFGSGSVPGMRWSGRFGAGYKNLYPCRTLHRKPYWLVTKWTRRYIQTSVYPKTYKNNFSNASAFLGNGILTGGNPDTPISRDRASTSTNFRPYSPVPSDLLGSIPTIENPDCFYLWRRHLLPRKLLLNRQFVKTLFNWKINTYWN